MKNANVKAVISANYAVKQFLEHLQENYSFSEEEKEQLKNIKDHMINLNVIFSKIKK